MSVDPEVIAILQGKAPAREVDGALVYACGRRYPIGPHGCINSLEPLSPEVLKEIEGSRQENPGKFPTIESAIFRKEDIVSTLEERKRLTKDAPKDYYVSSESNFRYAFRRLTLTGRETVLEIGASLDMPFLMEFVRKGCTCFATDIFYNYAPHSPPPGNLHVVLGDMNNLPYQNERFDIVYASATTHHSPDLTVLMSELSRVLKPGGWLLILNDPTPGWIKHTFDRFTQWSKKGAARDHLIHENEYSPLSYRRLARNNGLALEESFFSLYYDKKLKSGNVKGVRFSLLARIASLLWRVPPVRWFLSRPMLLPAQLLIGLEVNMIFRKVGTAKLP